MLDWAGLIIATLWPLVFSAANRLILVAPGDGGGVEDGPRGERDAIAVLARGGNTAFTYASVVV
ncbi:MAG: hypothetical protein AAF624_17870 [Bacteroidota bacterium]